MSKLARLVTITLAAAAIGLIGAASASADTNKNEQNSDTKGALLNALSPGAGPGHTIQKNGQHMTKSKTNNASVIDYLGFAVFRSSV